MRNFQLEVIKKIKETLERQVALGYETKDNKKILVAFNIAARENGALDILNQKEQNLYDEGMRLFVNKHLTII